MTTKNVKKPKALSIPKAKAHAKKIYSLIAEIDKAMESPQSHERGQKIAKLVNRLELAMDLYVTGELGVNFRSLGSFKDAGTKTKKTEVAVMH